jgi:PLP dependent protein
MSENEMIIRHNLVSIRERITAAAAKSGRIPEDITVIGVTKTVEPERILQAVGEHVIHLGENRVQELCEKYDTINEAAPYPVKWHLIGHLQTNKVKYILDKVSLIHSLDSMELAREIQKRAEKAVKTVEVLVQVNVAGEETKFGMTPAETLSFVRELKHFDGLKVRGLMTVAPMAENPEDVRGVFRSMKKIFIDIKQENIDNIDMAYLSMGMSGDFEVAIEEGANLVRIGSAIFGKRSYPV